MRKAAKMMVMASRGQRRDRDGRYMDGDDMPYMGDRRTGDYERTGMRYEDPRFGNDGTRMRTEGGRRYGGDDGRMEHTSSPRMGGEGYGHVIWDRMPSYPPVYLINNGGGAEAHREPDHGGDYGAGNITSMREYGRKYRPERMSMNMGGKSRAHAYEQQEHHMGFGAQERMNGEDHELTLEKARHWVEHMKNADGSRGGRWNYEEIRQYAQNFGITGEEEVIEFFAMINAMYSDYCKVAQKFGVNKPEFYGSLAKAWMDDKDAVEDKTAVYFDCIAMK